MYTGNIHVVFSTKFIPVAKGDDQRRFSIQSDKGEYTCCRNTWIVTLGYGGNYTTNPDLIFTLILQLTSKIQMALYYFKSRGIKLLTYWFSFVSSPQKINGQ